MIGESISYTFLEISERDLAVWQDFLSNHPSANYCHSNRWAKVFFDAYGKPCRYFGVTESMTGKQAGFCSTVFMNSPFSGKLVLSLPYLDYGALLAISKEAEQVLITGLISIVCKSGYGLELRSATECLSLPRPENLKVAMTLSLKEKTQESYWKLLDAKVRNQVRKAEKSGVILTTGGIELLEDFYKVFCVNMRDLGSPVHAKSFFQAILKCFSEAEIVNAYRENRCVGGLIRIRYGNTLSIPWASTLRAERIFSPNNALYYDSIRVAFERGVTKLDFGRSTRDEGTYKFKKQWLAEEAPLYWYQFNSHGVLQQSVIHAAKSKWEIATKIWTKMPIGLATFVGSKIRPFIPA